MNSPAPLFALSVLCTSVVGCELGVDHTESRLDPSESVADLDEASQVANAPGDEEITSLAAFLFLSKFPSCAVDTDTIRGPLTAVQKSGPRAGQTYEYYEAYALDLDTSGAGCEAACENWQRRLWSRGDYRGYWETKPYNDKLAQVYCYIYRYL